MHLHRLSSTWVLAALTVVVGGGSTLGCSSSSSNNDGSNTVDCTGTVPTFAEVTGFSKCTSCHATTLTGAARLGAPTNVNYDTYDAAKTEATAAVDEINGNSMPPSGSPTLTAAEITGIKTWAGCGTPQ